VAAYDDFLRAETTRRALLRRAGATIVTLGVGSPLLAACGSDTEDTAPEGSGGSGGGPAEVGGSVDYLAWEGYDLPEPMKPWNRENDVKFRSTYIGTHDDIQAKLKSGGSADYDLITYYQGFVDLYRKLDILAEIDESKIPNLSNVDPFFTASDTASRFWIVDGKRYGVPFTWGSQTLDYRPDKIDQPESWMDLLKPEFKGKVGWVPDATAAFTIGGIILGYDVPNYTQEQFKEVAALLRRFRAQARNFAPSFGDLANQFASGDIVASFAGWAAVGSFAKEKDVVVKSIVPDEGSFSFCDAFAIPPEADNADTVHAWINQALSPEVQAQTADSLSAGIVVPTAQADISKAVRAIYPDAYDDLSAHFENVPLYPNAPIESTEGIATRDDWAKEWGEIQAGN
jgi:spermidine/putrescine transport system substrate-binding protein